MTTPQHPGPHRRHTSHANGETDAMGTVRRAKTTHHQMLADVFAADAPSCQVIVLTTRRPRAVCGCGWAGHKRLTAAGARLDAWLHAAQARHMPAIPLMLTVRPSAIR